MPSAAIRSDRVVRNVEFLAALWITLATALLCALVPAGAPRTVAIGSAFNPATTVEALRTVSPSARQHLDSTRAPDGKDRQHGADPMMIATSAALPQRLQTDTIPTAIAPSAWISAARFSPYQPRAPPVA